MSLSRRRPALRELALAALSILSLSALSCVFSDPQMAPPKNARPVFTEVGDTVVYEGDDFSLTLAATDPQGTGLVYSLLSPPEGATLTGNRLSWTPDSVQAGTYTIRVIARDSGNPDLADTLAIKVKVRNGNEPPVLQALRDTTLDEWQSLTLTLSASDAEDDSLTYAVVGAPAGARLTGKVFTWTPDSTQAGSYDITFTVTQVAARPLSDTVTLRVTVRNVTVEPIPASALVAYWDFNEAAGTLLADKTAGGRNVTLAGSPARVAGVEGLGVRFNGSNYGQSTAALPDMTEQTLSAWVYLDQLQRSAFIMEANTDPGRDNRLAMTEDGKIQYETRGGAVGIYNGKTKMQTGRWYFVTATANPDTVRLYLNGVLDTATVGATNLLGSHYRIQIGRFYDGGGHNEDFTKGVLDEIKVYNKALTAGQVAQEWNRYRANVGQ